MVRKILSAIATTLISIQAFAAEVDVLFVIDDSGSMLNYQTALAAAVPQYAAAIAISGDDVNVAVVSTSTIDYAQPGGTCCGIFKGQTNSKLPTFASDMAVLFNVGTAGEGIEKPIDAAVMTFTKINHPENVGFLRRNSKLKIVFITDAYDQSVAHPSILLRDLDRLVGVGRYEISAAFIPAAVVTPTCSRDSTSGSNTYIEDLIAATGGQTIDLCSPHFAANVARIF